MNGFAKARVERLIRDAGAFRVSSTAIESLNEILTNYGESIAKRAVTFARHNGRKTVKDTDIKLAVTT